MYSAFFVDSSTGEFLFRATNTTFLPNVGDEIQLTRINGTFKVTKRIFSLMEGNQTEIHATIHVDYR